MNPPQENSQRTSPGHARWRLLLLGDARQVHLERWAAYFLSAGWTVQTITLETFDGFPGSVERVAITPHLPGALRYPAAIPKVRRIARAFRPHVVNAHFVPNYGVIANAIGFRPWVLSAWGSDVLTNPNRSPFHRWRARRIVRGADWVTSDAHVMTRRLERMGVPPGRILTFPFGVDTARFSPPASSVPDLRVISTRQLAPLYDVSTLIDAFAEVKRSLPGAALTIAGDGPQRAGLERRAEKAGISSSTRFVGALPHDEMSGALRAASVYVSTAHSDTTSVSLLEAMACGLFPIVPDIPANREWIRDGRNGFLFPAGDAPALAGAIARAWNDPALRARAYTKNIDRVERDASWPGCMRAVHELFDRLARTSGGTKVPQNSTTE